MKLTQFIVPVALVAALGACGPTAHTSTPEASVTHPATGPNTTPPSPSIPSVENKAAMRAALGGFKRSVDKAEGTINYAWTGVSDGLGLAIGVSKSRGDGTTQGVALVAKFNNGSCIAPTELTIAADGARYDYDIPTGDTDCPLENNSFPDIISWQIDNDRDTSDLMPAADYKKIAGAKHVKMSFIGVAGDVKTFSVPPAALTMMRNSITGAGW